MRSGQDDLPAVDVDCGHVNSAFVSVSVVSIYRYLLINIHVVVQHIR